MTATETEIVAIGSSIADALPGASHKVSAAIDRRAMALADDDAAIRAALFRLVDVAPACQTADELARHLAAFLDETTDPPATLRAARWASQTKPGRLAAGSAASIGVRRVARRFIAGEDVQAASDLIIGLWKRGVATSIDLLGEAAITSQEADRYAARCHEALDQLATIYRTEPKRPDLHRDGLGEIPLANLSVKVSALTPLLRAEAPEGGRQDAERRLRELLTHAAAVRAHLHIDMETLDSREAITSLVLGLLADPEFAQGPSAGVVLQAYLRDAPVVCEQLISFAHSAGRRAHPLVVRLVKGAYWDHEVVEAKQNGWDVPVFEDKAESDRCFERLSARLLEARATGVPLRPAIASHNLRSIAHAIATTRALGLDDSDLELQVLRGLGDELQQALSANGLRVRMYCPIGDLVSGMAYLVRRLLENSSNQGFLHAQANGATIEELLRAP